MAKGDEPVKKYSRSSLRVLGTVGEPINPEAWRWYYEVSPPPAYRHTHSPPAPSIALCQSIFLSVTLSCAAFTLSNLSAVLS